MTLSRKIIAFLGTYPKKTQYAFDGNVYTGQVFPEALYQFVDFDQMLVFVTKAAKEKTWPVLAALRDERIQPVPIPKGETTAEMWAIFDEVLKHVNDQDTVIFDITHGLRSAPFLVFLFAAFLKIARDVNIEAVYYGAYELGNPKASIPAPVIDLSEFVNMVDWLTATNRFVVGGDGMALAALLRAEAPPGLQRRDDLDARVLGKQLEHAADSIEDISSALRVERPIEAMQAAHQLILTMQQTDENVFQQARPFQALAEKISASYGQFGLADPIKEENLLANLCHQLAMIQWYLDNQQIVQAVLLSREWLISVLGYQFKTGSIVERKNRYISEKALYDAKDLLRQHGDDAEAMFGERLKSIPNGLEVVKLWQQLTEIRNDIAHCGMRLSAQKAHDLMKKAQNLYPALEKVAAELL